MNAFVVCFIVSFLVCAYIYTGYPLLMWVLSRVRERQVHKGPSHPSITLVIPVYNERDVLSEKIENALSLDYDAPLEIIVISDGSTDGSVDIAHRYASRGVRLLQLPRSGKAAALNAGAARATGDILVFTDANALLDRDGLKHLAENFADAAVGGVCGNKKYRVRRGSDITEAGENLYWRYDKWQKQLESRFGSIFAADGTLYAIRRPLYTPIEDPAQADDIAISTHVVLKGFRLVYEPLAIAWEDAPVEGRDEFRRKIRVTNHSVRALLNLGAALWTSGFYSVELLSHKLLRHLAPFFLIPLLISSAALASRHPLLASFAMLQLAFYLAAMFGYALRHRRLGQLRLFTIPYYFSLVNAAALCGVLSIATGTRLRAWQPRGGLG